MTMTEPNHEHTTTTSIATAMCADIPMKLFAGISKWINPVKLQRGSSVPVISTQPSQRPTPTKHHHGAGNDRRDFEHRRAQRECSFWPTISQLHVGGMYGATWGNMFADTTASGSRIPVSCLAARWISVTRPSGPPHVMPVALQHHAEGVDVDGMTQLSVAPQPEAANAAQSASVPLVTAAALPHQHASSNNVCSPRMPADALQ
jgi:hypothetical protein